MAVQGLPRSHSQVKCGARQRRLVLLYSPTVCSRPIKSHFAAGSESSLNLNPSGSEPIVFGGSIFALIHSVTPHLPRLQYFRSRTAIHWAGKRDNRLAGAVLQLIETPTLAHATFHCFGPVPNALRRSKWQVVRPITLAELSSARGPTASGGTAEARPAGFTELQNCRPDSTVLRISHGRRWICGGVAILVRGSLSPLAFAPLCATVRWRIGQTRRT